MTNETKNTEKTTEPKNYAAVSKLWGTTLENVEAWRIGRANLAKWLDEQEKLPFGAFFETKSVKNTGDFSSLALAIMTHTTTGNIDAKYKSVKMKALEDGVFDKQACVESFIQDILAPNLAELRAQKEKELAEQRAERLNLVAVVNAAIEATHDAWTDAGLEPSADLANKAAKRKLEKEHDERVAKAYAYALLNDAGVDPSVLNLTEADSLPNIDEKGDLI